MKCVNNQSQNTLLIKTYQGKYLPITIEEKKGGALFFNLFSSDSKENRAIYHF